jgi:hypothetical protein
MKKIQITLVLLAVCVCLTAQVAKTKFDYTRLKGSMPPEKTDYCGKRLKFEFNTPRGYSDAIAHLNSSLIFPFRRCSNWDIVKKDAPCDIIVSINTPGITDVSYRYDTVGRDIFIVFQYRYPCSYKFMDAANNAVMNEVVVAEQNELFMHTIQNNFPEQVANMDKGLLRKHANSLPFASVDAAKAYWSRMGASISAQAEKEAADEMSRRLFSKHLKKYGSTPHLVDVYYQKPNPKKTDIDLKDLEQIVALVKAGCDSLESAKGYNSNFVTIFKKATDYYENMVATNDPRMVDEIPQLVYWNGGVCYLFQQEYQKAGQWFSKYEKALGKSAAFREEFAWEQINNFVSGEYKD